MIKLTLTRKPRQFISKAAWRVIGDKRMYLRSELESNVAHHLQSLKEKKMIKDWEYEPHTFWFPEIRRGVRSYKPDFKVHANDGSHYWIEAKGYMDPKSKTKIKRLVKYYPNEMLIVIKKGDIWRIGNNNFCEL